MVYAGTKGAKGATVLRGAREVEDAGLGELMDLWRGDGRRIERVLGGESVAAGGIIPRGVVGR